MSSARSRSSTAYFPSETPHLQASRATTPDSTSRTKTLRRLVASGPVNQFAIPGPPVYSTYSTPVRKPPPYRNALLVGKNVDDFLEESNGLRKEISVQREKIEELTLRCKKLERDKHRQNLEFQKILETISDSTSKDKDTNVARLMSKLKRRLDVLEEQIEEKNRNLRFLEKTLKLNQKRETRVELENAYAEIDRLRRLLSCSVLPQQSADLGNGGEGFGQRNRCRTTKNAQNDKFQNARLTALTKAIRALHREKEAVSQLNNELLRQLQKCKQCCPKTERTGRRRPSGNSLPAGTVIATPINAPKADAATERGTNHREDRSPVEPYIDAVEADDMQIRFGDLERRNQYLEKQKQELEASYSNMLREIAYLRTQDSDKMKQPAPRSTENMPSQTSPQTPDKNIGNAVTNHVDASRGPKLRQPPVQTPMTGSHLSEQEAALRIQRGWREYRRRLDLSTSLDRYSDMELREEDSEEAERFLTSALERCFAMQRLNANEDVAEEFLRSTLEDCFAMQKLNSESGVVKSSPH